MATGVIARQARRAMGLVRASLEARALGALPTLPCQADRLRLLDQDAVRAALASPEIAREWESLRPTLEGLGVPDGTGGVNPGDRRALYALVRYLQPSAVLEIGTHIGASTLHIASALARGRPGAFLRTVDVADVNDPSERPWLRFGARHSPAELLEAAGHRDLVTFHRSTSLGFFAASGETYDFVFLDGDHAAATVYREVPAALWALRPDGVILLHDYFPARRPLWDDGSVVAGPSLAIERLRREGAPIVALPLGDLPWPTKLGSRRTSLALLARDAGRSATTDPIPGGSDAR